MFRGLKSRFIILLVLIVTMAIVISSYVHLRIQHNQLMDITREKMRDIAGTVEKSIRTSMEEGKSKDVRKIIQAVGTIPDILKIRIFSKRGVILISSIPDETGKMIESQDLQLFHEDRRPVHPLGHAGHPHHRHPAAGAGQPQGGSASSAR